MTKQQFNIRLDSELKEKLEKIAEIEKEKTGYPVTVSSLSRKILTDFINNYKK